MRNRLASFLLVLLLAVGIGAPWAFLQSLAWAGMLAKFSTQTSLSNAVHMTFDGKHPCKLCHFVREGRAEQAKKDKDFSVTSVKLDLLIPQSRVSLLHPSVPLPSIVFQLSAGRLPVRPPVPPPRAA